MKIKFVSVILIMVLLSFIIIPTSNALVTGNDLIKVNGNTITKTMTIEQVNSLFGNPKIETESAFGGKAYSYYDDEYNYYLFLETDSSGTIMSYGAIGGNFEGRKYYYGMTDSGWISPLSGHVISDFDTDEIYGAIEYNCNTSILSTYWGNYQKDSSKYLYGLQEHSIAVSTVLAKRNGKEFIQTYTDEEIFYISEQLKYNGTTLYDYAKNNGKTNKISITSSRVYDFYECVPNPILLGKSTENYSRAENFKYMLYDINMTDYTSTTRRGYLYYLFIDPTFLEKKETVTLTDEENSKLEAAKAEFAQYEETLDVVNNQFTSFYEVTPQYDTLPLEAGKVHSIILEGVTHYLNTARAGIGINTLTLDEDIVDAAQHKAVLVYYNSNNGYESGHFPEQPEGVSDEYYNKAQSYMNENLYMGNVQTSIVNALNDGYGDPITCGHRYNLLDPNYTRWGAGHAGTGLSISIQGCHKFSGYQSSGAELVAWPSNGIMPIELINYEIGNWTAQFYKNYSVTTDTDVTIKCLNTGKVYEITKENSSGDDDGKFLQTTGSRLVTFRDDSITYEHGDIFEITLHNMKNDSTGEIEDYTYRSVFYKFSNSGEDTVVTDIELDKTKVELSMGTSSRVLAKIVPDTATNKLMIFESANENIAKVRQDGTITGVNPGETTITVKSGVITKTITVKVNEYLKGDINNDGKITTGDLSYGLVRLTGTPITEDEIQRGDVTGDGKYTTGDLSKMMKYLTGGIDSL